MYSCNGYYPTKGSKNIITVNNSDYITKYGTDKSLNIASVKLDGVEYKVVSTIEKVIFHDPATIVYWTDGTKTVVKTHNESCDKEKGLSMAIAKKTLGKDYKLIRELCEKKEEENLSFDIKGFCKNMDRIIAEAKK